MTPTTLFVTLDSKEFAMAHPLVVELRDVLARHADAERAPQMQRYMKSTMPFHGVSAAVAKPLYRGAISAHPIETERDWQAVIRALYDEATHREERYAALAVLRVARYKRWLSAEALELCEHLIRTGSWWDLVDETSTCVGLILHADRDTATELIRRWAHDDDLWVRRAAIICQRTLRTQTDLDLLTEAIEASVADPDFFARKGIGWALREYSKTDADWVIDFVSTHPQLSPLSQREALNWLASR